MFCVCTKRVGLCNTELVCKAVRMAFSCQTSAIGLPFIPIPCSIYIVQLLNWWVLAVTVFTLYSCWTTRSQLWEYIHCTIIDLQGPSCDSMYIIQLLYCRVPAVKEEYVYYTVILLQGPSCEGGVCILYSYCTAGSQLWGRCMYIIQLLYCRAPAVREVYVQNLVSTKEDASRNTINSNSNKISIFYRPTD